MKKLTLPSGSSGYGTQMGRQNSLPKDPNAPIKLRMVKLKWVDGDYDQFGAYWGGWRGNNVYCAFGEDTETQVFCFVRGEDRNEAKEEVILTIPGARFYR